MVSAPAMFLTSSPHPHGGHRQIDEQTVLDPFLAKKNAGHEPARRTQQRGR
jgi:hypothetical protein